MFKVVTWYTPNYKGIYEKYLESSLKSLDIEHQAYAVRTLGHWTGNTNQKPGVAKMALEQSEKDILLLDADCKIHLYPELFNTLQDFDMALFYLQWKTWYNKPYDKEELCSGTLFLRKTEATMKLIDAWLMQCRQRPHITDQNNLDAVIKKVPELKIYRLPIEYCWINSLPNGGVPTYPRPEPVYIEHYQASRQMRGFL